MSWRHRLNPPGSLRLHRCWPVWVKGLAKTEAEPGRRQAKLNAAEDAAQFSSLDRHEGQTIRECFLQVFRINAELATDCSDTPLQ